MGSVSLCADHRRSFLWRHLWSFIGHVSPEAASGGSIGLIEDGDLIAIDIPNRGIQLQVSDAELAARREAQEARGDKAWTPKIVNVRSPLRCVPTPAWQTSADKGGAR